MPHGPRPRRSTGLSYLLVPMDQPGIEIRPIVQTHRRHTEFNEVFFDGARTAAENVVGEVDGGWRVAMGTSPSNAASRRSDTSSRSRGAAEITDLARRTAATTIPSCGSSSQPRGAAPGSSGGTSCAR